MKQVKTFEERQKELQTLLADAAGREVLQELQLRYAEASGKLKPPRSSVITYILVHERELGLIAG